ncbi:XdhC family protein [Streptomyces coeruleorubidus]|uniref:XdhC family protein n=1 Tax=Streptomyces coeruleorubidus TaxID=116188 RepID=A0ABZ0KRP4_STRC4|nr:XdhC family protein [Streptomyces coeruleorubidus]WOT40506.1 XdhC family protein [Streptomyces coeruleorubidus]
MATVVDVTGSAPLPVGTSVTVDADGNAVGSISGGCVEGAVYGLCQQVLNDRGAPQRAWFGYSDDAFAVGLTCGGELDVLVQRIEPAVNPRPAAALADIVDGRPAAVAQGVAGPRDLIGSTLSTLADDSVTYGSLDGGPTGKLMAAEARARMRAGRTSRVTVGGNGDGCPEPLTVFVHASRPRMLIFGAVDFAAAFSQAGHFPK